MKRYCLALDLIDDPALIAEYEECHTYIWPEITQSIFDSGITNMQIYRIENRLFMIIETEDRFSFEQKAQADAQNLLVKKWEELMWKYQKALPSAKKGEKWLLMRQIFETSPSQ